MTDVNDKAWIPIGPESDTDQLKPFLKEVATTIRVLQRQVDDLRGRVEQLEQDRLSRPGWEIDEGS